ncbi:hypothetical protein ACN42_g3277 [Penicillium freii]|uniref:Uncharacterized protein n=1 Tax=Penicillium freii TaxID=48697 RepID=A0A101MNJ7_PENFR|nr:hypothetical protein ACN42_g3277 [Penicillium freii]
MTMTTLYSRVAPRPAALGLNVILGFARMWTERSILVHTQVSIGCYNAPDRYRPINIDVIITQNALF